MSAKHTISINGQAYDAITGLPVVSAAKRQPPASSVEVKNTRPDIAISRSPVHHSVSVHQQVQKSETLRRGHLKAPESKASPVTKKQNSVSHVERSALISHFASHPKPLPRNHPVKTINDIGPIARHATTAPSTRMTLPSSEIKKRLIANASTEVDRVLATNAKPAKQRRTPFIKKLRKQHVIAGLVAFLLLTGYVTYLNVPGFSVRIAAAQAGINAKYPEYNPDGYSFQGPVAFEPGKVELQFKSNGGGEGYTIIQKNSDWNSVAVLDNLVNRASSGEYEVNSTGGVTVYTYGTKAAWTNGGVLYTIDGGAPLNSDQLLRIASSM